MVVCVKCLTKEGDMSKIFITGGAGYVGAMLVPKLLNEGHEVTVFDLFLYGENVFPEVKDHLKLKLIKGDIRNIDELKLGLKGQDTVIHLACISNDPSFDLDPELGKSINYLAFEPLVKLSVDAGVTRFINASSSSVYGLKSEKDVHEELALEPLTEYSIFKVKCEQILLSYQSKSFNVVNIRPATVCGYSPRQRLDVVVNIMTNHAYNSNKIKVFGGSQLRPNIHIDDMCRLYLLLCEMPVSKFSGKTFNAGYMNLSVGEIAEKVRANFGEQMEIVYEETDDLRSYHISSKYLERELGFTPEKTVDDAIKELKQAFNDEKIPNPFDNNYYNVKKMKEINLH
jgi:nucleoside-diphosphate-sugar epimerase